MQFIPGGHCTKLTKHWFKIKFGWNIRHRLTRPKVYRFSTTSADFYAEYSVAYVAAFTQFVDFTALGPEIGRITVRLNQQLKLWRHPTHTARHLVNRRGTSLTN